MARRRQLIEMIGAESNRRRMLTIRRTLKSVDRVLATLKAQLDEIDHDIDIAVSGSASSTSSTPAPTSRPPACSASTDTSARPRTS